MVGIVHCADFGWRSRDYLTDMTDSAIQRPRHTSPNKAAAGSGAVASRFQIARFRRAMPELRRSATSVRPHTR
jgi:hypothetical protein